MTPEQRKHAEALRASLEPYSDEAEAEDLAHRLHEVLRPFIEAATAKPQGVKASERKNWPQVLLDAPITRWLSQSDLAQMAGVETRSLQRYHEKGLPSYGEGPTRRYPYPHAFHWLLAYSQLRRKGLRIEHLPLEIAKGELAHYNAYISAGRLLRVSKG